MHKQHELKQKTILADKSLNKDEKIWQLNEGYDQKKKVLSNEGTKRICEKLSIRMFSDIILWTLCSKSFKSRNNDIYNLIRKCQTW